MICVHCSKKYIFVQFKIQFPIYHADAESILFLRGKIWDVVLKNLMLHYEIINYECIITKPVKTICEGCLLKFKI